MMTIDFPFPSKLQGCSTERLNSQSCLSWLSALQWVTSIGPGGLLVQSGRSGLEQPSIRANPLELSTRFSIRSQAIVGKPFKLPHLSLGCVKRARSRVRAVSPVDHKFLCADPPLSRLFKQRPLGQGVKLHIAPQRNQQPSSQRYDADLAYPSTALAEALLIPSAQFTFGLKPQPVPRRLDRIGSHIADPCLTDPLVPRTGATLIGAGHQPTERGHLAAVLY